MLIKVLGAVFFMILIVGVIGYCYGWVRFDSDGDTKSIKVNSKEMQADTNRAIDKGKEFVEKTGEFFKGKTDSNKGDKQPSDASLQN